MGPKNIRQLKKKMPLLSDLGVLKWGFYQQMVKVVVDFNINRKHWTLRGALTRFLFF